MGRAYLDILLGAVEVLTGIVLHTLRCVLNRLLVLTDVLTGTVVLSLCSWSACHARKVEDKNETYQLHLPRSQRLVLRSDRSRTLSLVLVLSNEMVFCLWYLDVCSSLKGGRIDVARAEELKKEAPVSSQHANLLLVATRLLPPLTSLARKGTRYHMFRDALSRFRNPHASYSNFEYGR